MSNKVPVPIYNRPEVGDVVDIDADTINTLRDRVSQAQLARAGITALMSGAGATFGATANPKAGGAQRVFNTLAGSALGYGLSRPVSDLASNQIVGPAAKRYSDEFNSQVDRRQLDEFLVSPAYAAAAARAEQVGRLIGPTIAAVGGATVQAAEFALGKDLVDNVSERLFGSDEDESLPANPILTPPAKPTTKRPIDDPSRRQPPVRPGGFVDRFINSGLRFVGPNSASGRSATHALDTDIGGLSFEDRMRKAAFQQRKYEAQQARQRNENRKRQRDITIGVAISLAALLAVGFTVAQASNVIKRIRRNMKANKASMDIVKLAQMGDIEGAQILMDREFEKASGVSAQALADATKDLSKKELRKAAQILKRELT